MKLKEEVIDEIAKRLSILQRHGSEDFPQAFELAEAYCDAYARKCEAITDKEKFDFRRGFELGYYKGRHDEWKNRVRGL